MIRPCPSSVTCPGTDSPLQNLSTEAPDGLDFLGVAFSWGEGWNVPLLGDNFSLISCGVTLATSTTPFDAQLQAIAASISCGLAQSLGVSPSNISPAIPRNNPQTCGIPAPGGGTSFYTVVGGLIVGLTQAEADQRAAALACYFCRLHILSLSSITSCCLGESYQESITASGGVGPYTIQLLSGSLPPGLNFSQTGTNQVTLAGLPTVAGNFSFVVQATDSSGSVVQTPYLLAVIGIANLNSLLGPSQGIPYLQQLQPVGGSGFYAFSINTGVMPPGLTMDANGLISGTPTQTGSFSLTVVLEDIQFPANTCFFPLLLTVISGLDWTKTVWGSIVVDYAVNGATVSGAFSGDHGTVSATGSSVADDSGALAQAHVNGTLSYKGPAVTAKVHMVGLGSVAGNPGDTHFALSVNGVTLKEIDNTVTGLSFSVPAGTYDFTFVIPDTLGSTVIISVALSWGAGLNEVALHGADSLTGSIKFS